MGTTGDKPTELAQQYFEAVAEAMHGPSAADEKMRDKLIFYGFEKLAEGLSEMSIGLRAAYIEIEHLKRTLKFQAMGGKP